MTGYQEIITDPSYAGQIITFTFPHIGNVGTNAEDIESINPAARGCRAARRHHRALQLARRQAARRLAEEPQPARRLRRRHAGHHAAHPRRRRAQRRGRACARRQVRYSQAAQDGRGLAGPRRHGPRHRGHHQADLQLGRDRVGAGQGLRQARQAQVPRRRRRLRRQAQHPALPCQHRLQGDGRAGDGQRRGHPAPQARRRVPVQRPGRSGGDRRATPCRPCRRVLDSKVPLFGICLGHQMLALALGGKTAQDGARPSRRQPAGQGPRPPARSRSPRRTTASASCPSRCPRASR